MVYFSNKWGGGGEGKDTLRRASQKASEAGVIKLGDHQWRHPGKREREYRRKEMTESV
jgi:hypothetical protein